MYKCEYISFVCSSLRSSEQGEGSLRAGVPGVFKLPDMRGTKLVYSGKAANVL